MLKDITVILIHYSDPSILYKALISLKKLDSRLDSIIVFQEQRPLHMNHEDNWFDRVQFITIGVNDVGETLNTTIAGINSSYVLFLQENDYLTPTVSTQSIQLPHPKLVLGTFYHTRNIVTHRPFLVLTSLLKKKNFLSNLQLPFKETLFPAWLTNVETSHTFLKEDLVRQARKNSSANTIEKQKFIQKYQLQTLKTKSPTISVLISNYNMEKYVETAVASSLLQNEQPEHILIIDDGSTDNSYQQLQRWDDGKQVIVFSKKNGGKANALNAILSHVTTDFILELDADDWLDPDAVSVIKKYLSGLQKDVSVLYGNLRKWKQLDDDVLFKGVTKGVPIKRRSDLLSYRFPLGPRIYRTSYLKEQGGFPVVEFENGRLYEDVSVLNQLIKNSRFCYHDFTVYNVREHSESITKNTGYKWNEFLETLRDQ